MRGIGDDDINSADDVETVDDSKGTTGTDNTVGDMETEAYDTGTTTDGVEDAVDEEATVTAELATTSR